MVCAAAAVGVIGILGMKLCGKPEEAAVASERECGRRDELNTAGHESQGIQLEAQIANNVPSASYQTQEPEGAVSDTDSDCI